MAVALGEVSHDLYDAAAKAIELKRIRSQEAIARAQISAQKQGQALGLAQNLLGQFNQRQAQQEALAQRAQEQQQLLNQRRAELQVQEQQRQDQLGFQKHKFFEDMRQQFRERVEKANKEGFGFSDEQLNQINKLMGDFDKIPRDINPHEKLGILMDIQGRINQIQPMTRKLTQQEEIDRDTGVFDKAGNPLMKDPKSGQWVINQAALKAESVLNAKNVSAMNAFNQQIDNGIPWNTARAIVKSVHGIDPGIDKSTGLEIPPPPPGTYGPAAKNSLSLKDYISEQKAFYDLAVERLGPANSISGKHTPQTVEAMVRQIKSEAARATGQSPIGFRNDASGLPPLTPEQRSQMMNNVGPQQPGVAPRMTPPVAPVGPGTISPQTTAPVGPQRLSKFQQHAASEGEMTIDQFVKSPLIKVMGQGLSDSQAYDAYKQARQEAINSLPTYQPGMPKATWFRDENGNTFQGPPPQAVENPNVARGGFIIDPQTGQVRKGTPAEIDALNKAVAPPQASQSDPFGEQRRQAPVADAPVSRPRPALNDSLRSEVLPQLKAVQYLAKDNALGEAVDRLEKAVNSSGGDYVKDRAAYDDVRKSVESFLDKSGLRSGVEGKRQVHADDRAIVRNLRALQSDIQKTPISPPKDLTQTATRPSQQQSSAKQDKADARPMSEDAFKFEYDAKLESQRREQSKIVDTKGNEIPVDKLPNISYDVNRKQWTTFVPRGGKGIGGGLDVVVDPAFVDRIVREGFNGIKYEIKKFNEKGAEPYNSLLEVKTPGSTSPQKVDPPKSAHEAYKDYEKKFERWKNSETKPLPSAERVRQGQDGTEPPIVVAKHDGSPQGIDAQEQLHKMAKDLNFEINWQPAPQNVSPTSKNYQPPGVPRFQWIDEQGKTQTMDGWKGQDSVTALKKGISETFPNNPFAQGTVRNPNSEQTGKADRPGPAQEQPTAQPQADLPPLNTPKLNMTPLGPGQMDDFHRMYLNKDFQEAALRGPPQTREQFNAKFNEGQLKNGDTGYRQYLQAYDLARQQLPQIDSLDSKTLQRDVANNDIFVGPNGKTYQNKDGRAVPFDETMPLPDKYKNNPIPVPPPKSPVNLRFPGMAPLQRSYDPPQINRPTRPVSPAAIGGPGKQTSGLQPSRTRQLSLGALGRPDFSGMNRELQDLPAKQIGANYREFANPYLAGLNVVTNFGNNGANLALPTALTPYYGRTQPSTQGNPNLSGNLFAPPNQDSQNSGFAFAPFGNQYQSQGFNDGGNFDNGGYGYPQDYSSPGGGSQFSPGYIDPLSFGSDQFGGGSYGGGTSSYYNMEGAPGYYGPSSDFNLFEW